MADAPVKPDPLDALPGTPEVRRLRDLMPLWRDDGAEVFSRCGSFVMDTPRSLINRIIVGGESGPGARPMHPDWARWVRDQCAGTSASFFFKQWGEWLPHRAAGIYEGVQRVDYTDGVCMLRVGKKIAGRTLDGRTWDEIPEVRHG